MNRAIWLFAAIFCLSLLLAQAESQEEQYVRIYNLVEQGDSFNAQGKSVEALSRYREAGGMLRRLKKTYPDWNEKMVDYRLGYLANKITALQPVAATAAAKKDAAKPADKNAPKQAGPAKPDSAPANNPPPATNLENPQVKELQEQLRSLQVNNASLEAKITELSDNRTFPGGFET
jgi:hypothetical protein